LEPIEERLLIAVLATVLIFIFVFVLGRYKRDPKSQKDAPVTIFIFVLLIMLTLFAAQYAQFRTYSILSIATIVIFSIGLPLLLSLMLWKFREARAFSSSNEITRLGKVYKLTLIFISYLLLLGLINTGFSFLFDGIINPQVVALTPEFERYAIPIMSGLVLVVYRFTGIFGSKITETLGKIFEDIVIFSVSMSWLSIVSLSLGIKIGGASLDVSSALSIIVVGVALGALAIEWFIVKLESALTKYRGPFSLTDAVQSMFSEMFSNKRVRQTTLDYFWKLKPSKPRRTINELSKLIDKKFEKFSPHYRGKVLRMSKILSLAGITVLSLACFGGVLLNVPHQTLIAAPAYLVELSVTPKTQLPSNSTIITSEEVESLQPMKFYAIPIVSVESLNGSFAGPLSRRLEFLNSTNFLVSETGNYLTMELRKITVETTVSAFGLKKTEYDQTGNSAFDYLGFFRDGEIYYAFVQHGFNQIFAFSLSSSAGEKSIDQKTLFSSNGSGESALVMVNIQSDIFAIDNTMLISTNEAFLNEATFLIQQTKLNTKITQSISNATAPFDVLDLP
jgi:hypothetical protein